ncbi:MAG: DivIVA domain-containing protein [Actinomycetota bacterium]|nr:DivIVA domain-containing protein [Actinomycetota bacterium]
MDISPQTIRSTGFKTVKKGYDPSEVDSFKDQVASVVEAAQNQATAMEARARAAVAKLQEVSQQVAAGPREAPVAAPAVSHTGDTEMISRTLLLAQRTADATVADARTEAESITSQARDEATRVLDGARTMAAKTVEDARIDARRAVEDERVKAENEVQSLLARRDFLLADVDHLEQYLQAQRERLRDAAVQLQELVDRVPGGLGDMRRPLLSASAEPLSAALQPLKPAEVHVAPSLADEPPAAPPPAEPPAAPPAEPPATPAAAPVAALEPDAGYDPSPLFTPMPTNPSSLTAMAMSSSPDAQENVWRLLDEEVASTQAAQSSFALDEVTAEVPVQPTPEVHHDPFRIGGDELR